ncbi:MAG: hypothetical protein Q9173_006226 [Seirophora scorigena]
MPTISTNYMVQGENFSKGMIAQIISAVLITPISPSTRPLSFSWKEPPASSRGVMPSRLHTIPSTAIRPSWPMTRARPASSHSKSATSPTGVMEQVHADRVKYNVTGYLTALQQAGYANGDEAKAAVYDIFIVLDNATLKFFKIDADPNRPRIHARWITTPSSDDGSGPVYDLVFVYFFVAAGLTLVLTAVLMVLNRPRLWHCKGDWATVGVRVVVGAGLALVAVMNKNDTSKGRFLYSPWMVPTVMLAIGLTVVLDGVLGWAMGPATEEEEKEKGRAQEA